MRSIILVFLGGGLGASVRYLLDLKLSFYGIIDSVFSVNILGSFILGILFFFSQKSSSFAPIYLLLGTGFCGGFTTFSSFSAKNFTLLHQGQFLNFAYYSFGNLFLGLLMFSIGYYISQYFFISK